MVSRGGHDQGQAGQDRTLSVRVTAGQCLEKTMRRRSTIVERHCLSECGNQLKRLPLLLKNWPATASISALHCCRNAAESIQARRRMTDRMTRSGAAAAQRSAAVHTNE